MAIFMAMYLIIGILITEASADVSEEYNLKVHSDFFLYMLEVMSWLPDMFNFFNTNNNE